MALAELLQDKRDSFNKINGKIAIYDTAAIGSTAFDVHNIQFESITHRDDALFSNEFAHLISN